MSCTRCLLLATRGCASSHRSAAFCSNSCTVPRSLTIDADHHYNPSLAQYLPSFCKLIRLVQHARTATLLVKNNLAPNQPLPVPTDARCLNLTVTLSEINGIDIGVHREALADHCNNFASRNVLGGGLEFSLMHHRGSHVSVQPVQQIVT